MMKTECCEYIRTLNEFALRLEEICQKRKALLSQAAFQGGAARIPYNYENSLKNVAKSKDSLEHLLTELESGFESHCQALLLVIHNDKRTARVNKSIEIFATEPFITYYT